MSCQHLRVIERVTSTGRRAMFCVDCGVEPAFGSAPRRTSGAEEIVRLKSELEAMRLARVEDHMTCARLREERDNAVRKWTVVCEAVGDLRKVDRATADWLEAYCRAADEVAP